MRCARFPQVRSGAAVGLVVVLMGLITPPRAADTVPGMPPVVDPANLYSETKTLSPAVVGTLARVYVPHLYVIDPATFKVVDRFKVGVNSQRVVPSWDLKTLWVTSNAEGRTDGSLTPIDPTTGKPRPAIAVDDPCNMYFSPDGPRPSWSPRA